MKPQMKKIVLASAEEYPITECVALLSDVIEFFQTKLDLVPLELQEGVVCEITSIQRYPDDYRAVVDIYYWRPETLDEIESRQKFLEVEAQILRQTELELLRDLKKKYPDA